MFTLNTITKDGDDISNNLSGRVIFSLGDNFGESLWWADEDEKTSKEKIGIDFYCGPETKEGYVEDNYDCGMYEQLEELFKSLGFEASIGASENYHEIVIPDGMEPEECWSIVSEALIKAGAIRKKF
jgi:hypothetical protein